MNTAEINHHIKIALQQAHISERKMQYHLKEENCKAATIYKVRAKALFLFAKEMQAELKKHERKTFKRVNN